MANKALDEINGKVTSLQALRRQADEALVAAQEDHAQKVAQIDADLDEWAEVLDAYWNRTPKNVTPAQE